MMAKIWNNRMSLQTDDSSELAYPAPLPPMVGQYLVRKRYVATGLRAIDLACSAVAVAGPKPASGRSQEIHSILLTQCGHLGDLIMTLPALRWIRQNRPEMRIGLVVGSWAKPMMAGIAELYDVSYFADHFMLDRSGRPLTEKLARHRQSWKLAAAQIRRDGYDAAIECYPFLQNGVSLLYATGIPVRAGFTSGGFGPLLTHRARWVHASRPFHDYPRDLLRMLFPDHSLDHELDPYYPVPPVSQGRPKAPYVVVQTGTGNPIREWPEDRWIALAKELGARGVSIVIAGAGPRERERAARIADALPSQTVLNLCDKLSWDEFTDLVAGAAHVICLESSTSHIAAAFRISSTVIMPATNDPKQFGPANPKARILTFATPCAPCFRSRGCDHMACIRRVSAGDAVAAVLDSLGLAGGSELQSGHSEFSY
jgi:ADP-heptose:LPS heptosyltransferase